MLSKSCSKGLPLFGALTLMYLVTYFGEGLVIMYLFNNVRINGLNISLSALFSLVSYVPSLLLTFANVALHSRLSLMARLAMISAARALVCAGLALSGAYLEVGPTIAFIALMEVLWYWLMPCFDELENKSIHSLGVGRGESMLTIVLQIGLAASLIFGGVLYDRFGAHVVLMCVAALQLCIPALLATAKRKEIASEPYPEVGHAREKGYGPAVSRQARRRGLLPLLIALGVVATIPQLANVVFPVKVFSLTASSSVAGGIDASYSVGALLIALIGIGSFVHRGSVRWVGVLSIGIGTVMFVVFSLSSSVSVLGFSYLVIGFTMTLARVRIRAEVFRRLKGFGAGPWYALITNITLICCTAGTVVIGLIGLTGSLEVSYGVIVVTAVAGIVASLSISAMPGSQQIVSEKEEI